MRNGNGGSVEVNTQLRIKQSDYLKENLKTLLLV